MRSAIIIPARYASTRLPGKPLLRATGKYLIEHVYEQASRSLAATEVIVATDDSRIVAAVESFGGRVALTRKDHASGTDRVAEVARDLDVDVIVNVQGDEPFIDPRLIDLLPSLLAQDAHAQMATLAIPLPSLEAYRNPNVVKVTRDRRGRALTFSRSPLPHVRDGEPELPSGDFLQHLGIYAYRREALLQIAAMPPSPLEMLEKLEQLRVLEAGWAIQVGVVSHAGRGVDTPDDYDRFVAEWRAPRALAA